LWILALPVVTSFTSDTFSLFLRNKSIVIILSKLFVTSNLFSMWWRGAVCLGFIVLTSVAIFQSVAYIYDVSIIEYASYILFIVR
jgi:hypothetical protein